MDLKKFYDRLQNLNQNVTELSEDVADSEDETVASYSDEIDDLLFEVELVINALKNFHKEALKEAGVEIL